MTVVVDEPLVHRSPVAPGVTQWRVVRSEWTKFRSLRSPWWSMAIAIALTIGIGALFAAVLGNHYSGLDAHEKATFDPTATGFDGIGFAQLVVGVLGVLLITGEYSTGMIRSSLTAVPRRTPVLWAKLAVLASATFVVMSVTSLITFAVTQAILDTHHIGAAMGDPGVRRAVLGAALYLTVSAVFGMAVGALLRNTAAGISAYVAVFFVLPPLTELLPGSWSDDVAKFLPGDAGSNVYSVVRTGHDLGPWSGLATFCGYTAVLVALAAWSLRRRDA